MDEGYVTKDERDVKALSDALSCSAQSDGCASFSVEEIRYYLERLLVVPDGEANQMLYAAISLLDDYENGIEAVIERKKQNVKHEDSCDG